MSLEALPPEIWFIIIGKLDTKSAYNLYKSARYFKDIVSIPGIITECHFSLNTLATVKSFESDFFTSVSEHLKVLNLSGIPGLEMSTIMPYLPALRRLKKLKDLDISYTNIIMPDYLNIVKILHTLKSLSINFSFGKKYRLTKKLLVEYQDAFKDLENVHFVGSKFDLLLSKVAIHMLNKCNLLCLKFTVNGRGCIYDEEEDGELDCTQLAKLPQFKIYFLADTISQSILDLPVFKCLDLGNYEMLIFQTYIRPSFHATPLLKEYVTKNFDLQVNDLSELFTVVVPEAAILLWSKETAQTAEFYSQLQMIMKEYLIYRFDACNIAPVPTKYKWYCIDQCAPSVEGAGTPSLALEYDVAFAEKEDVKLSILFQEPLIRSVTMKNCDYLKKLSHLCLFGSVQYDADFFNHLFVNSDCLTTLQIIERKGVFSVPTLLQYIPKSKLKNLFIEVREIHYFILFGFLSKCRTLQNIFLFNTQKPIRTLPSPRALFVNCDNLYNLCIKTDMYKYVRHKMVTLFETVKSLRGKDYINIDIVSYTSGNNYYSPFYSVFSIYQLRPSCSKTTRGVKMR